MKRLIIGILMVLAVLFVVRDASAYVRVRGYYRSSGTYVRPYYRTTTNYYKYDNWSYRGNVNPFTGARGYKW